MYASTFYWPRLLTGYSGAFPASYWLYDRSMRTFPDASSLQFLRDRSVNYLIVHEDEFGRAAYRTVVEALESQAGLREVARAVDQGHEARVYKVGRQQ